MKKFPPHLDSDYSLVAFLKLVLKPTQKKPKKSTKPAATMHSTDSGIQL
jgi:hypothetical protein